MQPGQWHPILSHQPILAKCRPGNLATQSECCTSDDNHARNCRQTSHLGMHHPEVAMLLLQQHRVKLVFGCPVQNEASHEHKLLQSDDACNIMSWLRIAEHAHGSKQPDHSVCQAYETMRMAEQHTLREGPCPPLAAFVNGEAVQSPSVHSLDQ